MKEAPSSDWEHEFYAIYRLGEGEILHRIGPPFIPKRKNYHINNHAYQWEAYHKLPDYYVFFRRLLLLCGRLCR